MIFTALALLVMTAIVYFVIGYVIRPLVPPFVAFELSSNVTHAKRARQAWQDARQLGRAFFAVILEMVLIPLYVITASLLAATVSATAEHPIIGRLHVTVIIAVWFVGFAHFAENIGLFVTLTIGARATPVFLTRILARIKYTVMALTVLWVIFLAEVYLYLWLRKQEAVNALPWLIAAIVIVGFLAARQLTMLSSERPSLLALQFAPSRLAAKDILERWGTRGGAIAKRALALESALAMLYGLTLAALCERIDIDEPILTRAAKYLAWVMLTAAACHLAQNVGAYVALHRHAMGWWVGMMRRLGRIRLLLLGTAMTYFIGLLIRGEWHGVKWAADKIKSMAPTFPWS